MGRLWRWIGANHEQLKIVFAIIAAIYVLNEYRVKVHDERAAKALDYLERYDHDKVFEARSHLGQFWTSTKIHDWTKRLKSQTSPPVRVERYNKELPKLLSSAGVLPDVHILLEYFSSLSLCGRSHVCDADTVCHQLFEEIQGYRESYRPIIVEWKDSLGDTAPDHLRYLAESACSDQFVERCKRVPESSYCQENPRT